MAAHRHPTSPGWLDTPLHPAAGVAMFLAGFVVFWLIVLYASAQLFGH